MAQLLEAVCGPSVVCQVIGNWLWAKLLEAVCGPSAVGQVLLVPFHGQMVPLLLWRLLWAKLLITGFGATCHPTGGGITLAAFSNLKCCALSVVGQVIGNRFWAKYCGPSYW